MPKKVGSDTNLWNRLITWKMTHMSNQGHVTPAGDRGNPLPRSLPIALDTDNRLSQPAPLNP